MIDTEIVFFKDLGILQITKINTILSKQDLLPTCICQTEKARQRNLRLPRATKKSLVDLEITLGFLPLP